jgi:cobalt-zinc-cadmium efflux system protein
MHLHWRGAPAVAGGAAAGSAAAVRLRLALAITSAILVLEVVGGLLANSLALLADAGHMLADAAALGLALFSIWFSRQPVTQQKSFGYLRWEILAALVNGTALLLVCAWIGWESISRFRSPEMVDGGTMLLVASIGLCANGAAAWLLRPVSVASLNVRGAYLHVLGDLLASAGAVVAALLIISAGLVLADAIASLVTAALIVRSAWSLVRESVDVLLEATPAHISPEDVRRSMESIPGVESVHDLHIWSVSSGLIAMSAHAIVREPAAQQKVLELAHEAVRSFGINHVTVQIEGREMPVCEGDGHQ